MWTGHLSESCLTWWPDLAECVRWTQDHHVRLWPHFPPQLNLHRTHFATEGSCFSSGRRQGRYLGQHKSWLLDQPHLPCGMESKKEVAPLKPDLCQPAIPAVDRRPFNRGSPTVAAHCSCHSVLQPQALPCDPAWQKCMTQHVLSCPELEMFIGRAARLTETK